MKLNELKDSLDALWENWRDKYISGFQDTDVPIMNEQILSDAKRLFKHLQGYILANHTNKNEQ